MKAVLVHGWESNPNSLWFPWLKKQLETKKYQVIIASLPNPKLPKKHEWITELEKQAGTLDEETVLIGHSLGCQAIMRLLDKTRALVKRAILVAPFVELTNLSTEQEKLVIPWLENNINWVKISQNDFVCVFSNDDTYVPLANKKFFEEKVNAITKVYYNKGHFTSKELPEILEFIP